MFCHLLLDRIFNNFTKKQTCLPTSKVIRKRTLPKYLAKNKMKCQPLWKEETEDFKKNLEFLKNNDWFKIQAFIFNEQMKKERKYL